jgi:hypothetical protein
MQNTNYSLHSTLYTLHTLKYTPSNLTCGSSSFQIREAAMVTTACLASVYGRDQVMSHVALDPKRMRKLEALLA